MLDVRRLILLREVQLRGGISAAAAALSYSHSAVSQQLGILEQEAGVPLLEKMGRGVRLTAAAEELARHTEAILAILERAQSDLAAGDTKVRGTLRLSAFTTISRLVVPQVVTALEVAHPELDIRYRQVEPETGLQMLVSRRIDVLIADGYPGISDAVPGDLVSEVLLQDPIRAYLPARAGSRGVDELRSMRWVLEPSGTEANAWARKVCHRNGFEPDVAYESGDLLFHARMVQEGLAAAFLPDLLVREAGAALTPTVMLGGPHVRDIRLVCRSGAEHRPAVKACRAAFVAELTTLRGDHSGGGGL